jgi:DNA-binding CsgD family transcriptional regulator
MSTKSAIFEIDGFDWEKVSGFLDALIKIESAAEFCKAVVHSGFNGDFIQGCQLYSLNSDAHLSLVAGYGLTFDHLENEFSIWEENPISESVRNKSFKFLPASNTSRPMIVVPLVRSTSPIGAMTLILDSKVDSNPINKEIMPVLEKLSTYWLSANRSGSESIPKLNNNQDGRNLTSRQLKILSHMADGLVNAEIASILVVSESTVRQETVRIYRELGVANRSDASRKGRLLGLIKSQASA